MEPELGGAVNRYGFIIIQLDIGKKSLIPADQFPGL
jgi:hypothetical protein